MKVYTEAGCTGDEKIIEPPSDDTLLFVDLRYSDWFDNTRSIIVPVGYAALLYPGRISNSIGVHFSGGVNDACGDMICQEISDHMTDEMHVCKDSSTGNIIEAWTDIADWTPSYHDQLITMTY